jgi:hypothetical protein
MFDNPTVFILGAGASCHYGYPTGEDLVKSVVDNVRVAAGYFRATLNGDAGGIAHRPNYIKRNSPDPVPPDGTSGLRTEWSNAIRECEDLSDRLISVDPLVIDYFLGHNPHLNDIGKFMIAWVLLEREFVFHQMNLNRFQGGQMTPYFGGNWYRFLIHKLVTGCLDGESLLNNKVTFVTFNYDVSLESQLFKGLSKLAQFSTGDVLSRFFDPNRFLHIYGKIRDDPIADPSAADFASFGNRPQPEPPQLWTGTKVLFDTIYEASKTIRTVAPHDKTLDPTVEVARRVIDDASCIYILGYGFDSHNSNLLELPIHLALERTHKTVLFTNFSNHNVINKNASRVFFGRRDKLLSHMPDVIGGETDGYLCERSTRNVYEALAFDFDSPEEHLLSATPI